MFTWYAVEKSICLSPLARGYFSGRRLASGIGTRINRMKQLTQIEIEQANQVAMMCYRAADSCNEGMVRNAQQEEDKFERRYGVSWRQRTTIKYEDYARTRMKGGLCV